MEQFQKPVSACLGEGSIVDACVQFEQGYAGSEMLANRREQRRVGLCIVKGLAWCSNRAEALQRQVELDRTFVRVRLFRKDASET